VCVDGYWWPNPGALLVAEHVRLVGAGPSDWWANCSWHRATGETRLGTFHEDDVRPDLVDRSYGREL